MAITQEDRQISKEIILAMINQGLFADVSNRSSQTAMTEERVSLINYAFKEIAKTVSDTHNIT